MDEFATTVQTVEGFTTGDEVAVAYQPRPDLPAGMRPGDVMAVPTGSGWRSRLPELDVGFFRSPIRSSCASGGCTPSGRLEGVMIHARRAWL